MNLVSGACRHYTVGDDGLVRAEEVEAAPTLLRRSDVGDRRAAALARRLRAWVGAEGASRGGASAGGGGYGGSSSGGRGGGGGRVDVIHGPLGAEVLDACDAVVCCDGAGPLSLIAGINEGTRNRPRRVAFVLAQSHGLAGHVFVDPGVGVAPTGWGGASLTLD